MSKTYARLPKYTLDAVKCELCNRKATFEVFINEVRHLSCKTCIECVGEKVIL